MKALSLARFATLLVGLVLSAWVGGCTKPDPPKITPKSVKVIALSNVGIEVMMSLAVENPNGIDLDAQSVEATLTLDGTLEVGKATIAKGVHLPAHQTVALDVPVSLRWKSLAQLTPFALRQTVPYQVAGEVRVGGALNIGVPFKIDGALTREQLTKLALSAIPGLPGL